jgi:hypothetical protein
MPAIKFPVASAPRSERIPAVSLPSMIVIYRGRSAQLSRHALRSPQPLTHRICPGRPQIRLGLKHTIELSQPLRRGRRILHRWCERRCSRAWGELAGVLLPVRTRQHVRSHLRDRVGKKENVIPQSGVTCAICMYNACGEKRYSGFVT